MLRFKQINEEVLFGDEPVIKVGREDIQWLKQQAERNRRKRVRLCAHRDVDDELHDMLIVHTKDTYVRPHKHLTKSESFHVIEGAADLAMFDEIGRLVEVVRMGDYSSGRVFYYRLSDPCYHTLLIRSDFLVFHEAANGPFRRVDTVLAPWSPDESDESAQTDFIHRLARAIEDLLSPNEGAA